MILRNKKINIIHQLLISFGVIISVSSVCFISNDLIGYKIVTLILLMTVSIIAMLFDITPVLLSAAFSALIWNFFFIPPIYTFHIENIEDLTMFFLYFLIAMIHAVLTYKIRNTEKKVRDREEKEHTIRLYNTLFNSLSHELRTPISTIIGSIDTLNENTKFLTPQQHNDLYIEIENAALRLNNQVENLLNISRLESGMLKLKDDWHDLNELIFLVIEKIKKQNNNHSIIYFNNEQLPLCKYDIVIIEQILYNILMNGIQYTPYNSIITITTFYNQPNIEIDISDNGSGIPEVNIPHVFEKFYRIEHSKSGGTGLGLSIVKGFVDAYHGKIILSNIENCGANFKIQLPLEVSFINYLKNE